MERLHQTLLQIHDTWAGQTLTFAEWLKWWEKERRKVWRLDEVGKFANFSAALLQRAMPGSAFWRRKLLFEEKLKTRADITRGKIETLLRREGYRFLRDGVEVVLNAAKIAFAADFRWETYFAQARKEAPYFLDDPFLKIRNVGLKTRNFALSLFLEEFIAPDRHIKRILQRLGLIGHHRVSGFEAVVAAQTLAQRLGMSLTQLDRLLWHLGRTVCRKNHTACQICPLNPLCLTAADR